MSFLYLCLVIIECVFHGVNARFNKDVVCIIDKGHEPVCESVALPLRRSLNIDSKIPTYDPYIPRKDAVLYNCTGWCSKYILESLTQISSPQTTLHQCYKEHETQQCENIRFHFLKNIDKTLFLSNYVKDKQFYLVDCLVYVDNSRVCHKKGERVNDDTHAKLVEVGTLARPNEANVLSQNEFLCEEVKGKEVNCDLNPFIPFIGGLKQRDPVIVRDDILLKTGSKIMNLKYSCENNWCGFSGTPPSRRQRYTPPGGKIYQCYYAKKQQICKVLPGAEVNMHDYNLNQLIRAGLSHLK